MKPIELYAKLQWRTGGMPTFKECAAAIVEVAKPLDGCLRCDWFVHEARQEAILMVVWRDAEAQRLFWQSGAALFAKLTQQAAIAVEFLGRPPALADIVLRPLMPQVLQFSRGIDADSGAQKFSRAVTAEQSCHIEIYTHFRIHRECLAPFKSTATELLAIVRSKDPGSSRYDWYFDDERLLCVALDTYDDAPAMFSHMKNCHDVHARLLDYSTMVTEFLGALPPDAMQAVAKYDPYIATFLLGLKPYSSGGFR